jgi:biotin carboxyl carrier protein
VKRKFRISVDGEIFIVELEELDIATDTTSEAQFETKSSESPIKAVTRNFSTQKNDGTILAPLPGVVSDIRVSRGDRIEEGAVLLVLEAMKMQNEIYAPKNGNVIEVFVEVGHQVGRGSPLMKIS